MPDCQMGGHRRDISAGHGVVLMGPPHWGWSASVCVQWRGVWWEREREWRWWSGGTRRHRGGRGSSPPGCRQPGLRELGGSWLSGFLQK